MKLDLSKLQPYLPFIKSILIIALITGLASIYPILAGSEPVNWLQVLVVFGLAVLFSLAHSLDVALKGSQPDLAAVLDGIISTLEKRYQPSAPTPLQGNSQGQIQGPLVAIHTSAPVTSPMPQNSVTVTATPLDLSNYPSTTAVWPVGSVVAPTNPANEDTAPRPIVQKDPS